MARSLTYLICFLTASLWTSAGAWADEIREFEVRVDGQFAGSYRLTVVADSQGRTVVTAHADVRVKHLLLPYTYVFSGSEVWQDGRLFSFQGECIDGGKKSRVSAVFTPDGPQISVNGRARAGKPCAWTSTFWQLPQAALENPFGLLLDADTGREVAARLERVGQHETVVSGHTVKVQRYRLLGEMPAELWFDENRRLVHQDSMDDGHHIEWILRSLRSTASP